MRVNRFSQESIKDRICIHCDPDPETMEEGPTYLIAEKQQGKTTETIRQAVFRRDTILSQEYDYYRSCGMKHASEAGPLEVSYIGIRDVLYNHDNLFTDKTELHLCVDGAKGILEALLTDYFKIPVKIDFMSIEA